MHGYGGICFGMRAFFLLNLNVKQIKNYEYLKNKLIEILLNFYMSCSRIR